ncbi:MAG: hypothetical protein R3C49_09600 [Planctomycetaceae bacterium]
MLRIDGHLMKPVKQSELFDAIVSVLGVNEAEDGDLPVPVSGPDTVTGLSVLLAEDNSVIRNWRLAC